EQELVDRLTLLTDRYRKKGDQFYTPGYPLPARRLAYLGGGGETGLLQQFRDIKDVSQAIREMNQRNMEDASFDARRTAAASLYGFTAGLLAVAVLAGLLAWSTIQATLRPIQDVTRSVRAIGAGDLDQSVPVLTHDELGELADSFNRMARQL